MFKLKYWPKLDDAKKPGVPGSPWTLFQVNQITSADVHPNGMIDVLGRQFKGNQYISLLKDPKYAFVAQEYSTDPVNNVPPTTISENSLMVALGPDGLGEIASGSPLQTQLNPLVILPNDTTPGSIVQRVSKITSDAADPYDFECITRVTARCPMWGYNDAVLVSYVEPVNGRYINYVFAATQPNKCSGLVVFWSVTKNPKTGIITPELEYYALVQGSI